MKYILWKRVAAFYYHLGHFRNEQNNQTRDEPSADDAKSASYGLFYQ